MKYVLFWSRVCVEYSKEEGETHAHVCVCVGRWKGEVCGGGRTAPCVYVCRVTRCFMNHENESRE